MKGGNRVMGTTAQSSFDNIDWDINTGKATLHHCTPVQKGWICWL